jgi:hypothetical protein
VGLTFIAIVLLVAAWAALLLPDLRKRHGSSRRGDAIASFSRQLSTLERARPGHRPNARVVAFPQRGGAPVPAARQAGSLAPRSRSDARRRRTNVFFGLVTVAVITLLAGVVLSPLLLVLHILADAALAAFAWALVDRRNRAFERETKLHLLNARPFEPEHMRRKASGS